MCKKQEKRIAERLKSYGLTIDINNADFIIDGYIEDVLLEGLKVTQLPNMVHFQKNITVVIYAGQNKNYKLEVVPCWISKTFPGNYQQVGFKIENPPESWTIFIQVYQKSAV